MYKYVRDTSTIFAHSELSSCEALGQNVYIRLVAARQTTRAYAPKGPRAWERARKAALLAVSLDEGVSRAWAPHRESRKRPWASLILCSLQTYFLFSLPLALCLTLHTIAKSSYAISFLAFVYNPPGQSREKSPISNLYFSYYRGRNNVFEAWIHINIYIYIVLDTPLNSLQAAIWFTASLSFARSQLYRPRFLFAPIVLSFLIDL